MNPTPWIRPALLGLALLAHAVAFAQAQSVWRCGSDGRSYSALPCAEGRQVEVGDPLNTERRREAGQVVDAERLALRRLASQRHERESAVRAGGLAGFTRLPPGADEPAAGAPRSKSKPKKKPSRAKAGNDVPWTAQEVRVSG